MSAKRSRNSGRKTLRDMTDEERKKHLNEKFTSKKGELKIYKTREQIAAEQEQAEQRGDVPRGPLNL